VSGVLSYTGVLSYMLSRLKLIPCPCSLRKLFTESGVVVGLIVSESSGGDHGSIPCPCVGMLGEVLGISSLSIVLVLLLSLFYGIYCGGW
jgi:hypothetical protein